MQKGNNYADRVLFLYVKVDQRLGPQNSEKLLLKVFLMV